MVPTRPFLGVVGLVYLLASSACATRQAPSTSATAPTSTASAALSQNLDAQIVQYVEVQVALAADDFDEAQNAVDDLLTIADETTSPLVRSVAAADDIETMRARFKPLSEYLAAQELPQGYASAYCPMYDGGSNWVQADGPVRNPYYGSVMLTCGVLGSAEGAHMDHTPRQNGLVFMAPDSFHHIEGTYPEQGVFRLYATDNYREPVDMSTWGGRVVLEEEYDAATDEFTEVVAFDLVPSPDGDFLEAVVGDLPLPAEIIAKVIFLEDLPVERFDFIFSAYSVDGGDAVADAGGATSPVMAGAPENVPLAERVRPQIPELSRDIVAEIGIRDATLQELIGEGRFTEIFIPALQAKELGLALMDQSDDLSTRQRNDVRIAVRHLVRAAYLLDWYGDLGNKQQVSGAYDIFGEAAREIVRVYQTP